MQIIDGQYVRNCVIAVAMLLTVGCSVTDLSEPVTELASAIEGSTTAIEQLDTKLTGALNDSWRREIIANKALLLPADDSCEPKYDSCSLVVSADGDNWEPFPVKSVMPKAHVGLNALRGYVGALKAIVDADTAGKVTASANQALGSLKNIEEQVTKARDPETSTTSAIATFETPVSEAITWFVGQYVESVKFRALAKATKSADPVIVDLALYHEDLATSLSDIELTEADAAYRKKRKSFIESKDAGRLTERDIREFLSAASDYNTVLKASHATPLKAFADAHAKLTLHLNGEGNVSLSEALSLIGRVREEAKTFQGIVEKFTDVAEESE